MSAKSLIFKKPYGDEEEQVKVANYLKGAMLVLVIGMALLAPAQATIEVSPGAAIGATTGYYEREPELLKTSGGTWFLAYSRSQEIYSPGGNPDGLTYDVYYSISADLGASWTECDAAKRMTVAGASFRQATMVEADGKIWIISTDIKTTPCEIYGQFSSDNGATWSAPAIIYNPPDVAQGAFHVDAVADGDDIWLFFGTWTESLGISYVKYHGSTDTWDASRTSTLSSGYQMPRVIKDGATFRMVTTQWDKIYYSTTTDPSTGTWSTAAIPGTEAPAGGAAADPTIYKDGDEIIWVAYAPWFATDKQRIEYLSSEDDGANWSAPFVFTAAEAGSYYWWDFRPCLEEQGGEMLFFMSSENNYPPVSRGASDILLYRFGKVRRGNAHYESIQEAVEAAPSGETVNVGGGNYREQVAINKSLSLLGINTPIIQAPAPPLKAYRIAENAAWFEPLVFAFGGTNDGAGNISGSATIEVTISGFNIDGNNAGTVNRLTGLLARNCQNSVISYNNLYELLYSSGLPITVGMAAYGNSGITLDHNVINDWTRVGIAANGDDGPMIDPVAVISNNVIVGEGILPLGNWAQNGIMVGYGGAATIQNNEVYDIAIEDPDWSASGINLFNPADGIILSGNYVHDCQGALNAYYCDALLMNGNNIFDNNDFIFFIGGDNIRLEGNSFTGNDQALYLAGVPNLSARDNIFDGNGYAIIADSASSNLQLVHNSITGSTNSGVTIAPYGGVEPSGVILHSSRLAGNAYGVDNSTANLIDASGNWWGDVTGPTAATPKPAVGQNLRPKPSDLLEGGNSRQMAMAPVAGNPAVDMNIYGVGDAVSALVDYSPWWGADYYSDAHASPWQWYLDDIYNSSLQEAVDAATNGDIINVLDGLYQTPLNIEGRAALTLLGQSRAYTLFKPNATLGWNVATYGTARQTAIRVVSSTDIFFQNMNFDFDLIKGNNISGFLYWSSTGKLAQNDIANMNLPDAGGGYYELLCYFRAPGPAHSDLNRAHIDVVENNFSKTGRVGIITHDYVDVLIEGNSFDKVDDDFGYGLEIGSMSTGIVRGNIFRNYDTWAATDQSAAGAIYIENSFTQGLGPLTKPVLVEDNEMYSCQYGVHLGNEFPGYAGDVDIDATISNNRIHDNSATESQPSGGVVIADEGRSAGSSVTALVAGNTIENNGDHGVYIYTNGNGDVRVTMTDNLVAGHFDGVNVKNFGATSGSAYTLAIHHNLFQNNLNADNDAVPGYWDDGIGAGNCWSDFESNPGYPTQYNVPGNALAIDRYPNVDCGSQCGCRPGDADGDLLVNIRDITYLINFLYKSGPDPEPYQACSGDPDLNCLVNIRDITYLINALYKGGPAAGSCAGWWSECGLPIRMVKNFNYPPFPEQTTPAKAAAGQAFQ